MKKKSIINKKNIILCILVIATVITSIVILNVKETVVKGEITIWIDDSNYTYLSESAKEFVSQNEKCKINVIKIDSNSLNDKLKEADKKNRMPDLLTVNSDQLNNILEDENYQNKIKNCNNIIGKNGTAFSKRILQGASYDGNYMSIPFTSRPVLFYLRQDMLEQYGYKNVDFNTWNDVINIGKDIYQKSGGKVKIINAVGQDKDYLVSILTMQILEEYNANNYEVDSTKIKQELFNRYSKLYESNILNTDENGSFLARFSSIEGMYELSALEVKCEWTSNYCPSTENGGNRFYLENYNNFIAFDNGSQKSDAVINKFITFISQNKNSDLIMGDKNIFLSYLTPYDTSKIDMGADNFSGKNPLIYMANILKKAPVIPNYEMYTTIKHQVKY